MTKIGKEVWLVVAAVAFLIAWLIDRLAGPVTIFVGSPIAFLTSTKLLNTYPFTAAAIIVRTFALFVSVVLVFSLFKRKYFTKAIILVFLCTLAEFFAIQQLATGFRVTTIQWTLSIAYASLTSALFIIWMIVKGIWSLFNKEEPEASPSEEDKSVLEPPQE